MLDLKRISVLSAVLIGLLLFSTCYFTEPADADGSDVDWLNVANTAWRYYQPGTAVYAITGLHFADIHYQYFTDWDLGVYFQAILDAEAIGLISRDGYWGADYRLNKLLAFLESRPLMPDGQPHYWYSAATGQNNGDSAPVAADTGNLLVALANLKLRRPDLASRIDAVVYNRTNYEPMKQQVEALANSKNIYDYHTTYGFACFWPSRFSAEANTILNNIVSANTVNYNGVALPKAKLLCEPLLLHVFGAPQIDSRVWILLSQVYKAHEARYNASGKFVAFTEGLAPSGEYVWEWTVLPDGRTWIIQTDEHTDVQITPLIYLKAAVSFLALYNTSFASNMVNRITSRISPPVQGFAEGIDENEQALTTVTDKTNGLILSAARYAIENGAGSAPTPTLPPSSTPSPTPSSPTPSSNPSSSPTPSPNASPSSSPTPSSSPSSGPSSVPTPTPSPPIIPEYLPLIIFPIIAGVALLSILILYRKKLTKRRRS